MQEKCFGCSCDTSGLCYRRLLNKSAEVRSAWHDIVLKSLPEEAKGHGYQIQLPDPHKAYLCLTCFNSLERFYKVKESLNSIQSTLTAKIQAVMTTGMVSVHNFLENGSCSSSSQLGKRPEHGNHDFASSISSKRARMVPRQLNFSSVDSDAHSPAVVVSLGYAKPKSFVLTPSRKRLGKLVARGSRVSIANECFQDPELRKFIISKVGTIIRGELQTMCSNQFNSVLRCQDPAMMTKFRCKQVLSEMESCSPTLLQILTKCTSFRRRTRKKEADEKSTVKQSWKVKQQSLIAMCVAMLCKFRRPAMCLIQKIISMILQSGHTSAKVFKRLQKMHICASKKVATKSLDQLGKKFDSRLKELQTKLLARTVDSTHIQNVDALSKSNLVSTSFMLDISNFQDDDFDSSTSFLSADVPLTSTPLRAVESQQNVSVCSTHTPSPLAPSFTLADDVTDQSESTTTTIGDDSSDHDHQILEPTTEAETENGWFGYKFVGDNIDGKIKPRFMRSDNQSKEFHYFHQYGIRDRINFSHLSEASPSIDPHAPLNQLIPTVEDDEALLANFKVLVTRVLVQHMRFFSSNFSDVVVSHIPHEFSREMAKKSEIVPLGVLIKNENKYEDMISIMEHNHQYVPTTTTNLEIELPALNEKLKVEKTEFHTILFGGDQLTAKRARGSQMIRCNSITSTQQINGLLPTAEDWHTKLCFLEVIWKRLYSAKSSSNHGTLYQLRNLIHRRNVGKKPKNDFNAHDDFFSLIVQCHILSASMEVLGMSDLDDNPSEELIPSDIHTFSKSDKADLLSSIVSIILDTCVDISHSVRCEESSESEESQSDAVNVVKTPKKSNSDIDKINLYAKEVTSLGLLYEEFKDAIHDGNGPRVFRCWKYLLLAFKAAKRKNYSIEAFTLLAQQKFLLSPRLSHQLVWSRFVNTSGKEGHNIPCDLHMEHLNRVLKDSIKHLGANKTKDAIIRVGKCIDKVDEVLRSYDQDNEVQSESGYHTRASTDKDRKLMLDQLNSVQPFKCVSKRKHSAFSFSNTLMNSLDSDQFHTWMKEKWQCLLSGTL